MAEPIVVTDFSLGQLSDRYAGRVDGARSRGAEEITGFKLNKDSGLSRRRGSIFVKDGLGITPATDRLYDAAGKPSFLVYKFDGTRWIAYVDGNALKLDEIEGAGTGSLTSGSLLNEGIRIDGFVMHDPETDASYLHLWTEEEVGFDVTLSSGPIAANSLAEDAALFQGRMLGIDHSTGNVNMSDELDFLDFVNDETFSRPLTLVAEFSGVETIRWLRARQGVYIGTDDGEWEIYSSFPFFSEELGGLMARRISDIGTQQAEFFGPSLAMRDLSQVVILSPAQGGSYQALSLSERIDNNILVQIAVNEYGTHRYLHALDVDGNLYTYMSAPAQQQQGWFKLAESVGWAVAFNKELYVAIERGSPADYSIEVFPLDELTHPGDRTNREHSMFEANDAHGDRGAYHILASAAVTGDEMPALTMVDVYEVDLATKHSTYIGGTMTDGSGDFAASLADLKTFTGWVSGEQYLYAHQEDVWPAGTIKTLPLTRLIGENATIGRVLVQVKSSTGIKVRIQATDPDGNDMTGGWEQKTVTSPESGPWEFRPEVPHGTEPRVEIQTVEHHPLNLYQILVDLESEMGG